MLKQRVIETNEGIQSEITVAQYNVFAKNSRDRGWIPTKQILKSGITSGHILEIGPGPGYLGLEWLTNCPDGQLTGLEISQSMINMANQNADKYHLKNSAKYIKGTALAMPFGDEMFDAVISNGSLHEWEKPIDVFNEIHRVLKPSGQVYVSDLKRDLSFFVKQFMKLGIKGKAMKAGLLSSIGAAYTVSELHSLIFKTAFKTATISSDPFSLSIYCVKK